MSTFDGVVAEFPNIRIDNFRFHAGRQAPAACFLSHVHSDHLLGLETLKMPFVYCSAATKSMLLRMEKYPHRINFAKGILETRKLTYKHLRFVLRALPLQTPVKLELGPKSHIQVTLFDANHCPGAVMFLIEGDNKAILYTGDVRAESWWVNSIAREPVLIPYTSRHKTLDCVYLDTTFASHDGIYRDFSSKSEGLQELLHKIADCSDDSVFYFRAWTLGYEDVWIALSNVLQSRIHVDSYQLRLFGSIMENGRTSDQAAALIGFDMGNQTHQGCLTKDSDTRIHSCEPGTPCYASVSQNKKVVWITPIISRLSDGAEVAEVGAGGGGRDFHARSQLELQGVEAVQTLRMLCDQLTENTEARNAFESALKRVQQKEKLNFKLADLELNEDGDIPLKDLIKAFANEQPNEQKPASVKPQSWSTREKQRTIHFPYSRHSSYNELRHLVSLFQPKDICPCTVDVEAWTEALSMQNLFGDLCSGRKFRYDENTRTEQAKLRRTPENEHSRRELNEQDSQRTESQDSDVHGEDSGGSVIAGGGPPGLQSRECKDTSMLPRKSARSSNSPQKSEEDCHERKQNDPAPEHRLLQAWRTLNHDSDVYKRSHLREEPCIFSDETLDGCSISYDGLSTLNPTSGHNVQVSFRPQENTQLGHAPAYHELLESDCESVDHWHEKSREVAYDAAIHCLETGDSSAWDDLRLRSLGWEDHTVEEKEL